MKEVNIKKDFYTVGIGASAGGLEALEELFDNMPTNASDMAFVVIQHLSPDYQSMMSSILAKRTRFPVCETENGMEVEADHIYLIPPKKSMTIYEGKLYLTDRLPSRDLHLPIDIFLYSLAKDQGDHAIAIILSGTGSDGTRGIRAIKEADGMIMVQQVDTAQFDGMPQNAIATGLADFILSPREMVYALVSYIKHPYINKQLNEKNPTPDNTIEKTLNKIMAVIKENTEIDFLDYKKNTLMRRIERRMGVTQVNSMLDYLRLLYQDEQEIKALCKELLIGVTKFFRDPQAFDTLSQKVITRIVRSKQESGEPIRVWVVGCSTGEEAYSIAILFAEYFQRIRQTVPIKIFATDIDSHAIDVAALGQYPESIVADLSESRFNRYFTRKNNKYEIKSEIRRMIVFSPHDVTRNPPFGKMDLISCRNLFIYFQSSLQDRIFYLFHFSLKPRGFLLLGSSENISGSNANLFTVLDNKYKIYQCKTHYERNQPPRRLENLRITIPAIRSEIHTSQTSKQFNEILYDIVIDKYMPPSIIIDENLDVMHTHGDLSLYLQIPKGIVSLNLSKMLHPSLAVPINVAFQNSKKRQESVTYSISFQITQEETHNINVHIQPIEYNKARNSDSHFWVIIFEEKAPTMPEIKNIPQSLDTGDVHHELVQRNHQLEQELQYTRETLQAALEEVESSNEELQSTNEELLASNEELQSTNEELQAVNEELITVNGEHQSKIRELVELNDDMDNLLRSIRIGTVFLDRELRVKRFTNDVQKEINLRDSDIDRPFEHLTHNLDYEDLLSDLTDVVRGEQEESKRINVKSIKTGKHYILQISPYMIPEQPTNGAILILIDYEYLGLDHAE